MPPFTRIYTDQQRDAVRSHPDATGNEISDRAAHGLLELDGERIPPFKIPPATVRDMRRRARRAAEGRARTALAESAPRDALEQLRRRLVSAADHKLSRCERLLEQGQHDRVSGEDLRQLARACREIAAIPGPDGQPAPARRPGEHVPGTTSKTDGGRTRGGLAGQIVRAHTGTSSARAPVPSDVPLPDEAQEETDHARATTTPDQRDTPRINAEEERDPGSFARASIAELHGPEHGPDVP